MYSVRRLYVMNETYELSFDSYRITIRQCSSFHDDNESKVCILFNEEWSLFWDPNSCRL
jgi:hypothetical protein